MKRLVLVFMLMLFSLQATWAAVGIYCQHESGTAAKHFGHHAHQHQADDNKPENKPDNKPEKNTLHKVDTDCTFCYAGSIADLTSSFRLPPATLNTLSPPANPNAVFSFLHERPERPKWVAAV